MKKYTIYMTHPKWDYNEPNQFVGELIGNENGWLVFRKENGQIVTFNTQYIMWFIENDKKGE